MIRACNRYLELSSEKPSNYLFDLAQLQSELRDCVADLAKEDRAITIYEPGGAAF